MSTDGSSFCIPGMTIGRHQSPKVEFVMQSLFAATIRTLLETRGLYQNHALADDSLRQFADSKYSQDQLIAEFCKRPVFPCSRGEGNDHDARDFRSSGGCDPLGTAHDEISLHFYLPNIQVGCTRCKKETTFLSMVCSGQPHFGSPYPLIGSNTEQVYHLVYRCGSCRCHYLAFQVVRRGLKLQLTGRTQPFRPPLAPEWPSEIRAIVEDSSAAAAENDLPAAYYHLRTAIEFLMKGDLGINVSEKIEGVALCEKYGETLDTRLRQGFPSFGSIYAKLSAGMHSRTVSAEEFRKLFEDALNHLRAKDLFKQYSKPESSANAGCV